LSYLLTKNIANYCQLSLWLAFVLSFSNPCDAQQSVQLIFQSDKDETMIIKSFDSRSLADSALLAYHSELISEGYLLSRLDTISKEKGLMVMTHKGPKYYFEKSLFNGESSQTLEIRYRKKRAFSSLDLFIEAKDKLNLLENNGYPFASLSLDSINSGKDSNHFVVHWRVEKGPFITLDDVVIKSEKQLPSRYIKNYLGIKKGKPYSESQLQSLPLKIKELAFIELSSAPEVVFRNNQATVYIPQRKKKNNYFNGVIGIRPNDITGQVNITGDVEIKLQNALNKAEDLHFVWKRLQPQTQDLLISTKIPVFIALPFAIDGTINIYRRDSTFSTNRLIGGISLLLPGSNYIRFFYESNQTNRLGNTSSQRFGDVNLRLFGLGYQFEKLDYKYNPRKGWSIFLEAATGSRNVLQNTENNTVNNNSEYYRLESRFAFYLPTFKKQTLVLQGTANRILTNAILTNEQYRIGGLRNIRGIDEESIFANAWAMATLEYRLLLDLNTAVYGFYDHAIYSVVNEGVTSSDDPFGFGIGINFQTKTGIFTFNYALGNQFENPILVRNAKISFGFRNIF
jgi:outer membrane protein assembly factor BamA